MAFDLAPITLPTAAAAVAVMTFASFIRSSVGFGEALIAMPLLALLLPLPIGAAYVALVAMVVTAMILGRDWRQIQTDGLPGLILGSWAGIPLGFHLLRAAPRPVVLLLLAGVLIGFCWHRMRGPGRWTLKSARWSWLFGLAAGVLGGAYNTGGPPVVIFGSLRHWTPAQFRSTIQAFALATIPIIVLGHWQAGRVTSSVVTLFAVSLPALAAAVLLGRQVNRRLGAAAFVRLVHALLLAIAATLIWTALREWLEPPARVAAWPQLRCGFVTAS